MKKTVNKTELIRMVNEIVMCEESKDYTAHILWDWMCSATEFIKYLCSYEKKRDPFHIAIRKQGLEAGTEDYVNERCEILYGEYIRIKITWQGCDDFTIEIN